MTRSGKPGSRRKPAPARPASGGAGWRAAIVVLAVSLSYANSLSAPFAFDDRGTILDNHTIEAGLDPAVLAAPPETPVAGRPVVNATFALNYAIGRREVEGYRAANIAIHVLCALALFGIARRALGSVALAFAVAIVWAVHPLNTEAVSYVTQRTESLMALFYLLTLYASIRAADDSPSGRVAASTRARWTALAIAACALGMGSKESMATAPVVVLLYDRVFLFESFAQAFQRRWKLYAGLAATWMLLAVLMWTAPRTLSAGFTAHDADVWTYLLNQCLMIPRYLWLALWPRALTLYYGWPLPLTLADVWPPALLVIALLGATVVALVRWPRAGFAGLWVFIMLAPTSSVIPIATEAGAERRMYLALMAIVALAVIALDRLIRARIARRAALAVAVAALMAGTIARNREYASSLRLAETSFERWPTPGAESMLGTELAAAGRFAEAEAHLRAAAPAHPPARFYLATVLARAGKRDEAIAHLQQFVRDQPPELDQVHIARGLLAGALTEADRLPEAIEQYRAMRAARPDDAAVIELLAGALVRRQSYGEAVELYRILLAANPGDARALTGLGVALVSSGRLDDAIEAFRRAAELDPRNPRAQQNLARALALKTKGPD